MIYVQVKAEKDATGNWVITQSAVTEALAELNTPTQPEPVKEDPYQSIRDAFSSAAGTKWIARVEGDNEWVTFSRKNHMVEALGNRFQYARKGSTTPYGSKLYGGNRCSENPFGYVYEVLSLKDFRKATQKRGTSALLDKFIA